MKLDTFGVILFYIGIVCILVSAFMVSPMLGFFISGILGMIFGYSAIEVFKENKEKE